MNYPNFPDDADIIGDNGEAFIPKGKNGQAIGPRYFAAKILKKNGLIHFGRDGWYEWTPEGWLPARPCVIKSRIGDLLLDEVRAYNHSKKSAFPLLKPKAPSTPAYDLVSTRSINEIMGMLAIMCDRGDTLPSLDPDVIPVQNGILRWNAETQNFDFQKNYTPDDLIFTKLNAVYDDKAESKFFQKKLEEILPDPEDRRVVQEYMGAALFPENRTRKFLLLQGEGGCGKSLIVKLVTDILTLDRTFDLDFRALRGNYAFSALTSQTLLTASEAVSDAFCRSAGIEFVKKAVGGDFFATAQKHRNQKVGHYGYYSLIVATNNKLKIKYDGRGDEFKDRLIPILFNEHIKNPDKTLADKLLMEHRSAILSYLVAGARRVRQNNWNIQLTDDQISRRDRIVEATRGVELFVQKYVEKFDGKHFTTDSAYKFYIYLHHVAGYEFMDYPSFQKRFAKVMADVFGDVDAKNLPSSNGKHDARGYRGVCLKEIHTGQ